jgi:hypothetical protein
LTPAAADGPRRYFDRPGHAAGLQNCMQLRVARLCLDCEELYVGNHCPVCASTRSAFLSTWLPSEERRRWRRPAPKSGDAKHSALDTVKRFFSRWFEDERMIESTDRTLRTRASDHVPNLDFDPPLEEPRKPAPARDAAELLPPQR